MSREGSLFCVAMSRPRPPFLQVSAFMTAFFFVSREGTGRCSLIGDRLAWRQPGLAACLTATGNLWNHTRRLLNVNGRLTRRAFPQPCGVRQPAATW